MQNTVSPHTSLLRRLDLSNSNNPIRPRDLKHPRETTEVAKTIVIVALKFLNGGSYSRHSLASSWHHQTVKTVYMA